MTPTPSPLEPPAAQVPRGEAQAATAEGAGSWTGLGRGPGNLSVKPAERRPQGSGVAPHPPGLAPYEKAT